MENPNFNFFEEEKKEVTIPPSNDSHETKESGNKESSNKQEASSQEIDKPSEEGKLEIYYLDVGQGDATFIILPNKESVLIDCAEETLSGKIVTSLHKLGYDTIDYLILTHPHNDHIGAARDILNEMIVRNIYVSPATHTTSTFQKTMDLIKEQDANVFIGLAGDSIVKSDTFSLEILAPFNGTDHLETDLNDASIITYLIYKNNRFLFMGDAEEAAEKALLKTGKQLRADVLKLGHHGSYSSTSDKLLEAVMPSYAVISCGLGNEYEHPHDVVMKRLKKHEVAHFRTDLQGDIFLESDGDKILFGQYPSKQ